MASFRIEVASEIMKPASDRNERGREREREHYIVRERERERKRERKRERDLREIER